MQFALSLVWLVLGLSLAIGTVMMIVGLVRAPDGYEDADGFKYAVDDAADATNAVTHSSHPRLA